MDRTIPYSHRLTRSLKELLPKRMVHGAASSISSSAPLSRVDLADPDWKTPNDDGSYPPPPHDASGHTWHHSDQALVQIIRDGSDSRQSRMPQFDDKLEDDDSIAIFEYFETNWRERNGSVSARSPNRQRPEECQASARSRRNGRYHDLVCLFGWV